jgi:hypothetical protein
LTGKRRFDRRRGAIWGVERPSDGAGAAPASGGGEQPAARRSAAASGGERRRELDTALGCTIRCGICTETTSARVRTQLGCPEAATARDGGARRDAAELNHRRRRAGGAGHGAEDELHRLSPYHTADPRSKNTATERRRRRGLEATADRGGGGGAARRGLGFGARGSGIRLRGTGRVAAQ